MYIAFTAFGTGVSKFLCYSEERKIFYWSEDDAEIVSYHSRYMLEQALKKLSADTKYTIVEFRGETEKKCI